MSLQSIIESLQGSLQNVGQNLQQRRTPSPFLPKQSSEETKRINLLEKRASKSTLRRNLNQQFDRNNDRTRIANQAINQGYVPVTPESTIQIGGSQPLPTPVPTTVPSITPTPQGRILDVAKYQGVSPTAIPLPNQDIQDIIWEQFPNEATQGAVALAGENAGFRTTATNPNNDGTFDYGLFQNNSKTLKDLLSKQRYAADLKAAGINSPEDVQGSAEKSALASKITRKYEEDAGASPFSWWYGWQNKGYNIAPERGSTEDLANLKYESGRSPYFKLLERVSRE